ncbi:DUF3040 domain-containing protein [Trebonia kvetii]|uniref:DUF3040 domain-containing protein n=1 Tax=Trebonia kvetii TaxID=2480626 RepID=A0A6P2BT06_9ACTN|nr:DUF3040 domain-containing protein [Trebonia kvetii]
MNLPHRQRSALRQIEAGLSCAEPRLASMMATFAWLTAGEDMPDQESCPSAAVAAAVLLARVMAVCLRGVLSAAEALWTAACGHQAAGCRSSIWGTTWYG